MSRGPNEIPVDDTTLAKKRAIFQAEALPHLDEIYASAIKMARNIQTAEDLAAKTFQSAWKSFDKYQPGTNIRAWLYRIMTNTYINDYRKAQRSPSTISADAQEGTEEFSLFCKLTGDRAGAVERFTEHDVNNAITKLPEDYRVALVLCDLQGFSYEEIARMTSVPIGTVRSRLSRGRKLLQKRLWDYSEEAGARK